MHEQVGLSAFLVLLEHDLAARSIFGPWTPMTFGSNAKPQAKLAAMTGGSCNLMHILGDSILLCWKCKSIRPFFPSLTCIGLPEFLAKDIRTVS